MRYLFAIVLPPLAVLSCGKPFQAIGNIFLTLAGWLPGVVHALFVTDNHYVNELSSLSDRIKPQEQLAWEIASIDEEITPVTSPLDQAAESEHQKLYSAPRRFDLATMLVVTTAFALLFTGMTILDFNFWVFLYFASLIVVVGICQSAFVPRYSPRSVSLIAGIAYHVMVMMGIFVFSLYFASKFSGQRGSVRPGMLIFLMFVSTIFSPALGYLSGVLVAGTFLVADQLRGVLGLMHLHRSTDEDQHEVSSPWDE